MQKILIGSLCFITLFLHGCGGHELKRTGYYLDSMFDVNVRVKNSREVRAQAEKSLVTAFGKLIELDTNLNKLSPISEISGVNSNAGFRVMEVGEMTYDLLKKSLAGAGMTDGYFDITWTPLTKLFEQGAASYSQIEWAKKVLSYQNIQLDNNLMRVRFMNNGVELDFDHIKRGYAVDMVVAELAKLHVKQGYIKAGTVAYYYNTVREKMKFSDGTYVKLKYNHCGVATVGTEEYYQNANFWKRYLPVKATDEDIVSVTAIAPNAATAEVLANACFFMGTEKSLEKIKELKSKSSRRSMYDIVIVYHENDKDHAVSTLKVRGRRH
jgi:thiamine biosynthesis lipoprotein